MKFKLLLILLSTIVVSNSGFAQKFGYIDSDYVLSQLTEYKGAQRQLDELSQKWEAELTSQRTEIDNMYKNYKIEEITLTPGQRKEREDAIVAKENTMREFEQTKFGVNGELFKKRQELIKPIQDKISLAISAVAKKNGLDFIFDKSANMNILFSNPKYDRSGDVLDELGVTVNEK